MKKYHGLALIFYVFTTFCVNGKEWDLAISKRLENGNQLSRIEKFDGKIYNIQIDGKFHLDEPGKFIDSIVSIEISSQDQNPWKNSLKSKYRIEVIDSKNKVLLTGSQSNFIKYDGWSVVLMQTEKYDKTKMKYMLSFWVLLIRGEVQGPEVSKNFVPFAKNEGSKLMKINDSESLVVFLGDITVD